MKIYTVRFRPVTVWEADDEGIPAGTVQIYRLLGGNPERTRLVGYVDRVAGTGTGSTIDGRRMAEAVIRHFPECRFVVWRRIGNDAALHGIVEPKWDKTTAPQFAPQPLLDRKVALARAVEYLAIVLDGAPADEVKTVEAVITILKSMLAEA